MGPGVMAETKGTLTIAQGIDADTLDPQVTSSSAVWSITLNIYDTMITRDKDGKLQPALAVSWRSLNDTTWEIKLRPNVKFHNGEPMDAEAVKFSILRVTGSELQVRIRNVARHDRSCRRGGFPYGPRRHQGAGSYPAQSAQHAARPDPASQVFERGGPRGVARKPIGAGPYKFLSWQKDEAVTLEAVPDHWRKPKIGTVIFKPIPEGASRVAAIKTGAVDIAAAIPPMDFASVNQGDKTFGINTTSNRAYLLNLDTLTFKPFQDRRVRQAINYAIDKEAIIKNTLNGYGKPLGASVVPEAFGYDPNIKPYPYDLEKAKQLLAEAGYPNGFEVGFDTTSGRYPQDKEIAEVVSGQLAKVGIKVTVQALEWGAFYDGVKAKKRAPIHNIGMSTELFDADNTFSLHFKAGTIWSRWNNPEFDKLVDTARSTMDEKARRQALWRAGQIQHDEAPMVFLHQISYLYGVNRRVKNWQPTSTEPILVWDASVD